jgi:hypothetical protein
MQQHYLTSDNYDGLPIVSYEVPDNWVEKLIMKWPHIKVWGDPKYNFFPDHLYIPHINFLIHETFDK